MDIQLANAKKAITVSDSIFAKDYNEPLIHQIVTAYMSGARAGTKAQKTRAEVSGGGAKPWKQKGTGRARAGTIRSPIWRKGGATFAAKPRSYKQKVNKKMYRGAICSILSELYRQNRLIVVDQLSVPDFRTKSFMKVMQDLKLNMTDRVLIISDTLDENLYLSARNLPFIFINDAISALCDPVSFVGADKVIITEQSLKEIEEALQ
jgi:large subunit ribosomal protein L4